jgi:TolB protein
MLVDAKPNSRKENEMKKATLPLFIIALLSLSDAREVAAQACRLDGARQVAVALTGALDSLQNPCFSPDAQVLAFTHFTGGYNTGTGLVKTVRAIGGAPLATLSPGGAQSVNLPGQCWSTISNEVAYSSDIANDRDEIYLAPAAGGAPRRITNRPGYLAWEPSVSPVLPDGSQWIVFESHTKANPNAGGELWKVRTDGGGLVQLTHGSDDRQPQWSPKGDRIVFQRQLGTDRWDVATVDINGGSFFNVTNNPRRSNTDPSWSPSGDYIVYSAGGPGIEIANLFVIRASGGTPAQVTSSCGLDGAPGWSPDGSRIAFESAPFDPDEQAGGTTLWVIDAPAGIR